MTIKAYLEVNDGADWAGHVEFDVKPQVGDKLSYGPVGEKGRCAEVVGFEHREQTGSWVFVVKADRKVTSQELIQRINFVDGDGKTVGGLDVDNEDARL